MPQFIMKLHDDRDNKDHYLMWSTIVDAPVTYGMTKEAVTDYFRERFGTEGMKGFDELMNLVEKSGVSLVPPYDDLDSYMNFNRAGKNETCISKQEIIDQYCNAVNA
jgi:hypothetical protein